MYSVAILLQDFFHENEYIIREGGRGDNFFIINKGEVGISSAYNACNLYICLGWLVGCIEDLRRFSSISAISRLGSIEITNLWNSSGEVGNRTPDLLLCKPRA